jgi:hypothetical protein
MRRPTGIGKTEDDLKTAPELRAGRSALLFNFDFDDATVKDEHKDWLRSFALPFLTVSKNTRIALNGMASRQGNAAYNAELSRKRMEAVKAFLIAEGVPTGQIATSFTGEKAAELAGRADGTDEEIDRAVALTMTPPPRTTPPRFEEFSTVSFGEFGNPKSMPYLMVPPLFGRRKLHLVHAEGMQVRTANPSIVRLSTPRNGLVVNDFIIAGDRSAVEFIGGQPGNTVVEVFDLNDKKVLEIKIGVFARKEIGVAFHFVKDKKNKTTRPMSDVANFIETANRVFGEQANLFFRTVAVQPLDLPAADLGNPVTDATIGDKFEVLSSRGVASARINVFFLWEYDDPFKAADVKDVEASAEELGGRVVVFEDQQNDDGLVTMAHEFGHCLGLDHVPRNQVGETDRLMWPFNNQRAGSRLTFEEATIATRMTA